MQNSTGDKPTIQQVDPTVPGTAADAAAGQESPTAAAAAAGDSSSSSTASMVGAAGNVVGKAFGAVLSRISITAYGSTEDINEAVREICSAGVLNEDQGPPADVRVKDLAWGWPVPPVDGACDRKGALFYRLKVDAKQAENGFFLQVTSANRTKFTVIVYNARCEAVARQECELAPIPTTTATGGTNGTPAGTSVPSEVEAESASTTATAANLPAAGVKLAAAMVAAAVPRAMQTQVMLHSTQFDTYKYAPFVSATADAEPDPTAAAAAAAATTTTTTGTTGTAESESTGGELSTNSSSSSATTVAAEAILKRIPNTQMHTAATAAAVASRRSQALEEESQLLQAGPYSQLRLFELSKCSLPAGKYLVCIQCNNLLGRTSFSSVAAVPALNDLPAVETLLGADAALVEAKQALEELQAEQTRCRSAYEDVVAKTRALEKKIPDMLQQREAGYCAFHAGSLQVYAPPPPQPTTTTLAAGAGTGAGAGASSNANSNEQQQEQEGEGGGMVAATGARLSNLTTSAAANASAAASTAASEASLWLGRRLSMGAQAVEAFVSKQNQQQQQEEQQ